MSQLTWAVVVLYIHKPNKASPPQQHYVLNETVQLQRPSSDDLVFTFYKMLKQLHSWFYSYEKTDKMKTNYAIETCIMQVPCLQSPKYIYMYTHFFRFFLLSSV